MKPAIALFARAPVPGQVKTRLIGRWTPEQVSALYRAFVLDMWEMLGAFTPGAGRFLYIDREHEEWRRLAGDGVRVQQGGDLGERMLHCFEEMRAAGSGPLLIVGSDSPALSADVLAGWTDVLEQFPALLGPAEDGGYYAIGCRAPHTRMFEGVEWSSARTLVQTAAALGRCGLDPAYLPIHFDVDTPEDLARLSGEPSLGPRTRRWLAAFTALRS